MLAAGLVLSALFRYDTGVYIGCGALTVIGITHAGDWMIAMRRAALFVLAVSCLSLPVSCHVCTSTAGCSTLLTRWFTTARRETARTRISAPLRFSIGNARGLRAGLESTFTPILVRWAASVDEPSRLALESQYRLSDGARRRGRREPDLVLPCSRISSADNLRGSRRDPHVEDTHGIDRAELVPDETWLTRLGRKIPILPGAWTFDNANAFLYHLLRWLPLLASVILLAASRSGAVMVSSGCRSRLEPHRHVPAVERLHPAGSSGCARRRDGRSCGDPLCVDSRDGHGTSDCTLCDTRLRSSP